MFFVFSSIRKASVGSSWCHGLYPVSRWVLYHILPVVCHITLPFPPPPPHPPPPRRKKHKHRNNSQTFSTIYSSTFVLGKEKFQRKRLLLPCIAGVSPVCECFFQWQCFYSTVAQQLFKVPAFLYSLLVCGKVAFQQTLDVFADRYYQLCTTFFPGSFLLPCSKPHTWLVYISDI